MGHVSDLPKTQARRRRRARLRARLRGHPGQEEDRHRAEEGRRRQRRPSTWPPTPTARGRPSPGTSPRSCEPAKRRNIHRVMFNEITKDAVREALRAPARDRHAQGRRAAGAPDPRPPGRLQDQPAPVGQGPARALRRPGPVGRGAHHRASASARSRPSRREEYWIARRRLEGRRAAAVRGAPAPTVKASGSTDEVAARRRTQAHGADDRRRRQLARRARPRVARVASGRDARSDEESGAALHHLEAPAGRRAQARLLGPSGRCAWPSGSTRASSSARRARSASSPTCAPTRPASRTRRWTRCASYIARPTARRTCPSSPLYSRKKQAQEAHEAIRPTSMEYSPGRASKALPRAATSCGCTR